MKKKKNYLDFVPVCAAGLQWKLNEKKLVEIEVQNKGFYNWLAQKFFKRPKVSYISLDESRQLCMAADGRPADHLLTSAFW